MYCNRGERERDICIPFLGLEISMEYHKSRIVNEINQNININECFFFFFLPLDLLKSTGLKNV